MSEFKKFEEFLAEAKAEGGKYGSYQMDNANNGIRMDSIFVNLGRFGAPEMNIKISMYSGGSDGVTVKLPKKLAELQKSIHDAYTSKDAAAVQAAEEADQEKSKMLQDIQTEIFEELKKAIDSFDKEIGSIINKVVSKY
jgi:hypothetical protein